MKVLLTFLVMLSFNAYAITTTHTIDIGVSHSTYTGHSKGVVNYASESITSSVDGFMHSDKQDYVEGRQKIKSDMSGYSHSSYNSNSMSMNGAEYSTRVSDTNYGNTSNTKIVDRYDTRGFEQNTNYSPDGSQFEREEYEGSFVTKTFTDDYSIGNAHTVETSWY